MRHRARCRRRLRRQCTHGRNPLSPRGQGRRFGRGLSLGRATQEVAPGRFACVTSRYYTRLMEYRTPTSPRMMTTCANWLSTDLFTSGRLARPGGGRRQLPTGTRPTANQEALRARCYSRCSTASLVFDPLLSRRQLDGPSLSQLQRLPRWWISVLERDPSLRGQTGPAGCHHSRSNLQANKQPINQKE